MSGTNWPYRTPKMKITLFENPPKKTMFRDMQLDREKSSQKGTV